MSHFSLNFQSSDKLWFTPTSMDPHLLSHHNKKHLPFLYHHSSLSLSDVDSDTTTNADTMSSSPPSIDQEYMFEKPLTPSDVGKLNRLVIPKQHAEKYFPLAAYTALDGDKTGNPGGGGVLLGFEDESGKCWKFRYSYWNSSQSYVLTKGWSRYIKENKLVAGDVVLFQRHRLESNRFFIGWRRRDSATPAQSNNNKNPVRYDHNNQNNGVVKSQGYHSAPHQHQISSFPSSYGPDCLHAAGSKVGQKGRQPGSGNSKRVRLFGVNLECQILGDDEVINEEPQTSDNGSSLSTQGQTHTQPAGSGLGVGPSAYNYFDYVGVGYPPNSHLYFLSHGHELPTRCQPNE